MDNMKKNNGVIIMNAQIKINQVPKEKYYKGKKGTYLNVVVTAYENPDNFGQNVTITEPQSQEEREAKKPKNYWGNGNVVFSSGNVGVIPKEVVTDYKAEPVASDNNDLPWD